MTRKDHLVQLVAAVLRPGVANYQDKTTEVVQQASGLLAEIEKELGEVRDESGRMRTVGQQQIDAEVAKAVSAGARLISAAPDLLEALQDLTTQIRVDEQEDCLHLLLDSDEYKAALSAIAKATGEGA